MTLIRVSPIKKGNYYTYNKLYLKLGNLELKSYYELLLNDLINPVDYLYEEFKKLK